VSANGANSILLSRHEYHHCGKVQIVWSNQYPRHSTAAHICLHFKAAVQGSKLDPIMVGTEGCNIMLQAAAALQDCVEGSLGITPAHVSCSTSCSKLHRNTQVASSKQQADMSCWLLGIHLFCRLI
jgi:hypothetical protein